jgi:hypothetical protein
MKDQEQGTSPSQPGLSVMYVKPNKVDENREAWVSSMILEDWSKNIVFQVEDIVYQA